MSINLKNIPNTCGIYQFFNEKGDIIYVGKSVNLKSRVSSYFNSKQKLNFGKQKMVKQIFNIKTIITNNETESLILETNLIKKYEPKYNILMKDGKNHIYLKITDDIIPKIIKTRLKKGKGIFFGPYTSTSYINNVLKLIKKVFGYRSCNIEFVIPHPNIKQPHPDPLLRGEGEYGKILIKSSGGIKIPCMDYYIKTCSGPCLLQKNNIKEYLQKIEEIKLFFKGNNSETIKKLEEKMFIKAKKLEFEEAEKIKKTIESIRGLNVYQIVREGIIGNYNIVNFVEKFDNFYIGMIEIRDSKITGFYNYDIKNELNEDTEIVIKDFIERKFVEYNLQAKKKEKKIIFVIPIEINFESNNGIGVETPKIGTKKDLLDLCYKNIYEYAYKKHLDSLSTKGFTKKNMENLLNILGYKQINKSIIFECNDISHISGNHTVASRSVIENGKPNKSKYKKFKIKSLEEGKIDDFGSMKEIFSRRLKELEKLGNTPDLIIIDGGKGQLSSVSPPPNPLPSKEGEENVSQIQVISIAKREEEIFLPGKKEPILLDKNSQELRLIQFIRDEAHRFAISFNRDTRIKNMKKNILESLPGIGPKTRTKLLKKYGNVENLSNIDKNELLEIITKKQFEVLEDHGLI